MTSSTGTVVFNDAKLQAIDVVATERLGVGTLDPTSNLHVVGNVHVTGNVNKLNFTDGYTIKRGANVTVFGTTDVIQEITGPHARDVVPLRKYPEVNMQDYRQGGYTASASSDQNIDRVAAGYAPLVIRSAWAAFNGSGTDGFWQLYYPAAPYDGTEPYDANTNSPTITDVDNVEHRGHWIKLELPHKIKVQKMTTNHGDQPERYDSVILLGSNDDTNWYVIKDTFTLPVTSFTSTEINSNIGYKYVLLLIKSLGTSDDNVDLYQLQYYGYEETSDPDTSVDTKITSQFNLPDTTGVKLYIDGDKGSTATDFSGEGHTLTDNSESFSGNAWSFTSLSTSNVTMSTGDFAMEGDHPHTVSMWFNAANVSSNATLFHVGTAAGEGDAKTAISLTETGHLGWIDGGDNQFLSANTWHNLVYATQGGGGVRTCYLDGRKLGDVSVQDTFGDYPPFAMSTYSQYGYTVSASSSHPSYPSHRAFNNELVHSTSNVWITGNGMYNASGVGTPTGSAGTTVVDGTNQVGEWLQIEFPHQLKVSYMDIAPHGQNAVTLDRAPKDGIIAGSRDGSTWETMKSWTGVTDWALDGTSGVYKTFVIDTNTDRAYKYIRIIITKTGGADAYGALSEVKIFGHKENDTTRFPVSSTVLKYPHVAMTGPAQRGYVVEGSSRINYTDVEYEPWKSFGWSTPGTQSPYDAGWVSLNTSYSTSSPYNANSNESLSGIDGVGSRNGAYLTVTFPRKLAITKFDIYSRSATTDARVTEGYIYGSQDKTTWYEIAQISVDSTNLASYTNTTPCVITTDSTTAYRYAAIQATSVGNSAGYISYGKIELYGTEPEDVIARVGEGLDGKVANFRVYDKYLHEEQALELWDAQKDQFGRAESSVVVHKGRLGVGTTEPEGRFAVADEPHNLEEFPPRAMTGYKTYFEGHGVFKASASEEYAKTIAGGASGDEAWTMFDKQNTNWTGGDSYTGTNNTYEGTHTSGGYGGDYIELKLPYKIKLEEFIIQPSSGLLNRWSKSGVIVAKNTNDDAWTNIFSWSGSSVASGDKYNPVYFRDVDTSNAFDTFRLVITSVDSEPYVTLFQWRLFGTRERGQSTLHDGSLTLTKNLTVPRIGPALDADDTPRRDRLVVEYNTSTNPTANGTVKDTSGRGVDGLMYNDASYDATEKALVFDGTDDYIKVDDTGIRGDYIHSVSFWIYNDNYNINPFWIGENIDGKRINVYITASQIDYSFRGDTVTTTSVPPINRWWHLTLTYNGTQGINGRKIYIDGVEQTTTHSGTATALNIVDGVMYLGTNFQQASDLNGKMSNFKLYECALTADEVKRLYDMGRCDEGHHVVNFSKTRVGIGLGDGEAPRGALDVRDLSEIKQLGVGMNGTGIHRPSIAPLSVFKGTFDELGGGIELMRTNTPEGNSGLGFNRGSAIWHAYKSSTNRETLYFAIGGGNYGTSSYDYNRVRGYIDTNNGGGNITFTGQHRAVVEGTPLHETEKYQGLIVSAKNNKYVKLNNGIETGSSAITINESVPLVSLSSVAQDKSCFGVISDSEDPDVREDRIGNFVTTGQKEKGDHRWFINSVGEGAMWVTDMNGALESGDYITTSNVAGYGQKQDSDSLKNYTVAKITMDCDFEPATQPIQCIKQSNVVETHYTGMVPVMKGVPHEFVTTTVTAEDEWSNVSVSPSDVTYAEWSNLEANTQNTYTLTYTQTSNVVYDVKYTKTTTANVTAEDAWDAVHIEPPMVTYAEYSNLEANVQNTYTLTYTMTTKVEATEAIYSNLSTEDKTLFIPTYYQMVEQTVDAEYPGAVKHETVTDRLENALDEHGQLQWEDDPSGATEKAYKIRYLDASGQQTDEANCVHRAAFVGCTYHCG